MAKAKLIIHPPGRPLPPDHPFAAPTIIFGMKPPESRKPKNAKRPDAASPSPSSTGSLPSPLPNGDSSPVQD